MLNGKGTLALVGSGEFLPLSQNLDQALLATLKEPPRVVVLPTASAPDGLGVAERWGKMGVDYFKGLGAQAEAVMVLSRQDAYSSELAQRIASANLVYLSGGKPSYLVKTLRETLCWQAIRTVFEQGGVVAGCSAGAMALAGYLPGFGLGKPQPALGLAPKLVVIPHFDEIPKWLNGLFKYSTKRQRLTVVGVEGSTGLVGTGTIQTWQVVGRGGVTVFSPQGRKRYANGETIIL